MRKTTKEPKLSMGYLEQGMHSKRLLSTEEKDVNEWVLPQLGQWDAKPILHFIW